MKMQDDNQTKAVGRWWALPGDMADLVTGADTGLTGFLECCLLSEFGHIQ